MYRILFATSELMPFLRLTETATRNLSLLSELKKHKYDIRVLMPRFGVINERRNRLHEVRRLSGISVKVGKEKYALIIKVASIPEIRLQVYFLDSDEFFKRKAVMEDPETGEFFPDNLERAMFFGKGILETIKKLSWAPDIIHCRGWFSGFIPFYLKTKYKDEPLFSGSKIIYTANDNNIDIPFPEDITNRIRGEGMVKRYKELYLANSYADIPFGAIKLADYATKAPGEIDPALEKRLKDANIELEEEPMNNEMELFNFYNQIYQTLKGDEVPVQ